MFLKYFIPTSPKALLNWRDNRVYSGEQWIFPYTSIPPIFLLLFLEARKFLVLLEHPLLKITPKESELAKVQSVDNCTDNKLSMNWGILILEMSLQRPLAVFCFQVLFLITSRFGQILIRCLFCRYRIIKLNPLGTSVCAFPKKVKASPEWPYI